MKTRHSLRSALALAGVALLIAAGCGGDDDDETSTEEETPATTDAPATTEAAGGDVGAYCEASLAVELLEEPDYDTATEGEILDWLNTELLPAARAAADAAPEEIAEDGAVMMSAIESAAETGDFSAFGPEAQAAEDNVHAFDMQNCGWETVDVQATDHSFGTIPAELESGPASFEFTNAGSEVHQMVLAKKNPGVTESVEELVQLSEEEALTKVTQVGMLVLDPGGSDFDVVELEAGDYVMVCLVPTGTTSTDQAAPGTGPPHAAAGMVAEFSVR